MKKIKQWIGRILMNVSNQMRNHYIICKCEMDAEERKWNRRYEVGYRLANDIPKPFKNVE